LNSGSHAFFDSECAVRIFDDHSVPGDGMVELPLGAKGFGGRGRAAAITPTELATSSAAEPKPVARTLKRMRSSPNRLAIQLIGNGMGQLAHYKLFIGVPTYPSSELCRAEGNKHTPICQRFQNLRDNGTSDQSARVKRMWESLAANSFCGEFNKRITLF
jgi:hypothetical protein